MLRGRLLAENVCSSSVRLARLIVVGVINENDVELIEFSFESLNVGLGLTLDHD